MGRVACQDRDGSWAAMFVATKRGPESDMDPTAELSVVVRAGKIADCFCRASLRGVERGKQDEVYGPAHARPSCAGRIALSSNNPFLLYLSRLLVIQFYLFLEQHPRMTKVTNHLRKDASRQCPPHHCSISSTCTQLDRPFCGIIDLQHLPSNAPPLAFLLRDFLDRF